MWTPADRALVGDFGFGQALTDDQFRLLEPLIPPARPGGRPRAIIDTQSVKTTESGGPRGWDAARRLKGRKRHVAVDTYGVLLGILVHAADIQDADGPRDLLERVKPL